jgi:CDP-4-dehydro-6-deoxyglucose reductase
MAGATRRGRVTSRRPLTPRVTELRLLVEGDEPFRWLAGQHVTVRPDLPDAEVSWFSIASAPDEARPNELTMAARNASELLGEVSLGDPVVIEGPFGKLTWRDAPGALLVGAGTGVAPMRAIAQGVLAGDRAATGDGRHEVVPIVLVAGNRTPSDLLWHDELVALAHDHERFTYEPVVSQPDASYAGRRGYVQEHLGEALGRLPAGARAYICGSTPMVNACLDVLGKLGMPLEVILSEADS